MEAAVCLVRLSVRDTRGTKGGYEQHRDGPMLHVGCTGVALTSSLMVCPAHVFGAWMLDVSPPWRGLDTFRIDGNMWKGEVGWRIAGSDEWKPLRVREFVRQSSNWWIRLVSERGRWKAGDAGAADTGLGWFALLESADASLPGLRVALAPELPSRHVQLVSHQNAFGLSLGDIFRTLPVACRMVACQTGASVGLVDCLCYPGGEGALVTDEGGAMAVGMLVAPLQVSSAPATLSIVVGLRSLWALAMASGSGPSLAPIGRGRDDPLLRAVAYVTSSSGMWGSGVYLGGDRVLTAAHVVRPGTGAVPDSLVIAVDGRAAIVEHGGFESLDVVTLRLEARTADARRVAAVAVRREPVDVGTPLLLVSYATQDLSGGPCVTRGTLLRALPWMLVSSNVAFSGSSGGALFVDCDPPQLLGLVISTPSTGKKRVPRLTLSLPVAAIDALLQPDADAAAVQALAGVMPEHDAIWSLALQPREPPGGPRYQALQNFIKARL